MDEIKTEVPAALTAEAKLMKSLDFGHINFESSNGIIQSNCLAIGFTNAHELNKYFKDNPGTFACQIIGMNDHLIAIVNRQLDDDEQDILRDKSDVMRTMLKEKTEAREEAKRLNEESIRKRADELERLAELGRKCETNHAAVLKENRKLKKKGKK